MKVLILESVLERWRETIGTLTLSIQNVNLNCAHQRFEERSHTGFVSCGFLSVRIP